MPRSLERRWATAIHESGHAVAALVMNVEFLFVSVEPNETSRGRCRVFLPRLGDPEMIRRHLVVLASGPMAEMHVRRMGDWGGCNSDFGRMHEYARSVTTNEDEAGELIGKFMDQAVNLVRQHQRAIETVATELLNEETITAEDVRSAIWRWSRRESCTPGTAGEGT